jgi:aspartyl-tRNA(Asn)/glutamyl-tRNA(Gln) amidotransferase subunit C
MQITEQTLDRIAELAKLDYSDPAARAAILADMERVLSFVERLNEVDTAGVEPLIFMTDEANVLRPDAVDPADRGQAGCAAQQPGEGQRLLQGAPRGGQVIGAGAALNAHHSTVPAVPCPARANRR